MIILLSYIITILYDNSETAIKLFNQDNNATKNDIINLDSINKVRCIYYPRPMQINKETKNKFDDNANDIDMYNDSQIVSNNGFSNELIKKTTNEYVDIDRYFENDVYIEPKKTYDENDINKFKIEKKDSTKDLPIGNIDINYLINNNTSMLS